MRHDGKVLSLDDLAETIRSENSRVQFLEAMRAYQAGAYRSATIALWIAVIQDFVEKLRTLADEGDSNAKSVIDELDAARAAQNIPRLQAIENSLLKRAHDEFELVTHREAEDLRRLYEDRNSCAHPTFQPDTDEPFQITEEQVRAHARASVDSVLAQPPRVGRALVDRFIADVKSKSWPEDDITEFLRLRYFDRARATAARAVLTAAVKVAIRPGDESNVTAGRCVAVIRGALPIEPSLVNSVVRTVVGRWRDGLSDEDLARCIGAIGTLRVTWDALGEDNASRAATLLLEADTDWLQEHRAFASGVPQRPSLQAAYRAAVARLDFGELDQMTRRPYEAVQWVKPALRFLADAPNFRSAEARLRVVVRLASSMNLDDVRAVGSALLANQQVSRAADTPQLLSRLIDETISIPGARNAWRETLETYRERYDPSEDPQGTYSYAGLMDLLEEEVA